MNEKTYAELMVLANDMKGELEQYINILDKCNYASDDIPVLAIRKRTQKHLSEISHALKKTDKILSEGY